MLMAHFGNFTDRVDRANFVVGVHYRDNGGLVADGFFDRFRMYHARLVHVQPLDLEAVMLFELLGGLADGVMLGA